MVERDGVKWITRLEASKILGCSTFKIRSLEAAGRLVAEKIEGRWSYRLEDVERLREELSDEEAPPTSRGLASGGDVDEAEPADPAPKKVSVHLAARADPTAEIIRSAAHASHVAQNAHRSALGYLERGLQRAEDRIRHLEGERVGLLERLEKFADRAAERELERAYVENVVLGGGARSSMVEQTVAPLIPALVHRVLGIKAADGADPVAQRVRAFLDSLSDEQVEQIMAVLTGGQKAALMDLARFVHGKRERKAAGGPAKTSAGNGDTSEGREASSG